MQRYTYYCEETQESYEPEPGIPYIGELRYFQDDDGKWREYEFTESGEWVG